MIDEEKLKRIKAMTSTHEEMQKCVENLPATETQVSTTVRIPFHGHNLTAVLYEGEYYVPMKPIVERFGLDWNGQYQRIKRDSVLSKGMCVTHIPSDGGDQEMVCLQARFLPGWLFTVDDSRIQPEFQETLIQYKEEMYDVMHSYLITGVALNPRMLRSSPKHSPSMVGTNDWGSLDLVELAWSVICEASDLLHRDDKIEFMCKATKLLSQIYPQGGLSDNATNLEKVTLLRLVASTGYWIDAIRTHALLRVTDTAASHLLGHMARDMELVKLRVDTSRRLMYGVRLI